ncbi:MAG: sigma-54 dependent transcriptional regulator [Pirellulales bacterium]
MTVWSGQSVMRGSAMDEDRELLLSVWREACRHIEIHQSAESITEMLGQHLPLAGLIMRRLAPERHAVETVVAVGMRMAVARASAVTTELVPADWTRLTDWARRGDVVRGEDASWQVLIKTLVPEQVRGSLLVGPLVHLGVPAGVVIVVAQPGATFLPTHVQLVRRLLDPLTTALENDRRLHELAALREAAEADRRSLLNRLGRQEENEEVVGAHSGLQHVMERVQLVSQSDVPVLILGETGTGKEVVARAIHVRSRRSGGPFIRVNCGAIPPELIDSQLFGHEKGSFTGAADRHQGWFERADGGTLFLDEIGELPLAAQVRLLRVLQDHQVERVGGKQSIHVDVRIVAATHRDLAAMVRERTFREDLWYRINIFPIPLPPLRDRLEDIPALVAHFSRRAAIRFGVSEVGASPADLEMLSEYGWPGNIRELGAVIDRAVILGGGRTLEVAKALGLSRPSRAVPISDEPTFYEVIPESVYPLVARPVVPAGETVVTLDEAMRQHIERALTATRGRIEGTGGAADLLGINPHTLRARMRKLRLDWSRFRENGRQH